jgi:uncharacterized membrane protein
MQWLIAYAAAALAFGILDAVWLGWAGPNFYRPLLGDLLAPSFRLVPALIFYALYIGGIVWFAVRPGLEHGTTWGVINGALLGGLAYATYDLTNQATLKTWPWQVTLADIAWGASATALATGIACLVTSRFAP